MKISTKGRYGLKAMIDIAVFSCGNEYVSLKSISQRQNISEAYLEQIISSLKKGGLVVSSRGASGGYMLGMDASEIRVGEILRILEDTFKVVKCSDNSCCNDDCNCCISKGVWDKLSQSVNDTANSIFLGELVDEYKQKNNIK